MAYLVNRIASLIVALILIVGGISVQIREIGFEPMAFTSLIYLVPLAFIWFPEVIASGMGYAWRHRFYVETPPFLVVVAGWFCLIRKPVVDFLINS